MLKRFGLLMMLMLTSWIPLQSVAAWQSMTRTEFVSAQTVIPAMTTCHGNMSSDMPATAHKTSAMASHDTQCAGCLPLCTGAPPAVSPWREFARQTPAPIPVRHSLYSDFIPGVVSPPPLSLYV
ncbi:hypothetical protein [Tolumonas lignilytica]|uniref:hypothetical protein n=1 Tax=Tolumonas lignilytica TaxID=1283284 RepID=UPI0004673777|nr:hypothetical protein [Tolumonas lignilytica]